MMFERGIPLTVHQRRRWAFHIAVFRPHWPPHYHQVASDCEAFLKVSREQDNPGLKEILKGQCLPSR